MLLISLNGPSYLYPNVGVTVALTVSLPSIALPLPTPLVAEVVVHAQVVMETVSKETSIGSWIVAGANIVATFL